MKKGIFITFEGIDASGKTTQVKKAVQYLRRKGFDVLFLREPGGEPVSEQIRRILLKSKSSVNPVTELLLYLASRSQLTEKKIIPALKKKRVVVCDRFSDSTLAYQGYGRGLDKGWIKNLNKKTTSGVKPDLTLLIDVPLKVYTKRAKLKRKIYPHLFRHSRAYELAQVYHFAPQELMKAGGWKNSSMLDVYYNPKGTDIKNKLLNGHGIKTISEKQREEEWVMNPGIFYRIWFHKIRAFCINMKRN